MLVALIQNNVVVSIQDLTEDQIQVIGNQYQNIIDITSLSPQPQVGESYASDQFGTPVQSLIITRLAFLNRFTNAELGAFYTLVAANIGMQILKDKLFAATYIDLTRSDTELAVSTLVSVGVITSDRANIILTTPASSTEIYRG